MDKDMDASIYDEDYFMRGQETKKSLYTSYSWKPELTIPMAAVIVRHCGIENSDIIVDYGCARGYVVKALRELGYTAYGLDVSTWAIDNCDPEVRKYVSRMWDVVPYKIDWFIAKDVLEHVNMNSLPHCINELMDSAKKGIFAVVPLSPTDGAPYVVADYELDVTHVHRLTLASWAALFMRPGWSVEARYRLAGVKDNYAAWERGNGFITARRI